MPPIRCTVEISSSTSVSVISSSRSCSSAAIKVTRSGTGCVRRWEGDSTAARARQPASHLLRDLDEQIRRQTDRPHRQQLVDLGEHRLQAHVARSLLDLPQHRRGVLTLSATACGSGVVLVGATGHQSRDPLHALRGQPQGDQGRQ
ncbi:hypothetical protein OG422_25420 [Streptomyces sp. NBC_01525]|uniref:hypothetical protein n=1 Tax=Streptomyces sp. NBC_01525 TaxID=2903893 RepID=UPI00386C1105